MVGLHFELVYLGIVHFKSVCFELSYFELIALEYELDLEIENLSLEDCSHFSFLSIIVLAWQKKVFLSEVF